MEYIQRPNEGRRSTSFGLDGNESASNKSEIMVLNRKLERLMTKERRFQVCLNSDNLLLI